MIAAATASPERRRLPRSAFALRPVTPADCATVFALRNAEHVRQGMYTRGELDWDGHQRWFTRMLADPDQDFSILLAKGDAVGVVGFSGLGSPHDRGDWTIYVGRSDAPKGAGAILGFLGLERFFEVLRKRRMVAEVLVDNAASLALHRKLGFREEGTLIEHAVVEGRPTDVAVFGMLQRDWLAFRAIVQDRVFL